MNQIVDELIRIVGEENVFTDENTRKEYGHDETEDLSFPPSVVVKPGTTNEVSDIMKLANTYGFPITPIGARTGLSGGALSVKAGIGLSMERFNNIIDIEM